MRFVVDGPSSRRNRARMHHRSAVTAGRLLTAACALTLVGACGGRDAEPAGEAGGASGAAGTSPLAVTPPGTDVWLADLHREQTGPPSIGEPTNLTQRAGYDNQPFFVPDGSGLWYTAVDEHDGQADIWRYDFAPRMVARVTASSPESEYSATPLPDGSGISVIRVEADSTQRLWRFDADGANASVILEDVAPVGYHAWADERTVVMFVLGSPATLQRADVVSGAVETIAEDVGRSIQRIPSSNDVSFVQLHGDGTSSIMRLSPGASEPELVVETVGGGDFHAWTPDGTLLMADGSVVYAWTPGVTDGWEAVADFANLRLTITRLAVSPDGSQIALVGEVSL